MAVHGMMERMKELVVKHFHLVRRQLYEISFICLVAVGVTLAVFYGWRVYNRELGRYKSELKAKEVLIGENQKKIKELETTVEQLENTDERQKRLEIEKNFSELHTLAAKLAAIFEKLVDLREGGDKVNALEKKWVALLKKVGEVKIDGLSEGLGTLEKEVTSEQVKVATRAAAVVAVSSQTAPDSGYRRQKVQTDAGEFVVDIVSADLATTRVIIDTASDGTCADNCPVLPLATYVARSGAFAGINGTYFCPESYPSCAGKNKFL